MDDGDRLYALPLDEFTKARDARARELRGDGKRDDAAQVAALRKPVLAAWVVNQLVRERKKDAKALVAGADAVRAGRKGGEERMRAALDELVRAARKRLAEDGREPTDAVVREVATTLRAGAAEDPETLLAGRLVQPLEPSGFAAMAGAAAPAAREPRAAPKRDHAADRKRVQEARKDVDVAREAARRLRHEAERAEREAERLRDAATRAAEALADAEARLAEARTN